MNLIDTLFTREHTSTHEPAAASDTSATPADTNPNFENDPFVADYNATASDRAALDPSELAPVNLDVQEVVPTVIGAARRMRMFREAIVKELPRFDIARFDSIIPRAQALAYAHSLYLSANNPPQELPQLFERAVELREVLVLDVTGLVKRGLVPNRPLDELKGAVGYANVASDLRVLTNIYQANWSAISGKTAVQSSELNEAARLFGQITSAMAERTQPSQTLSEAADQRQRAFVLVVRAYEDARRAIAYLRSAEGDADKLAPSMWTTRRGRRGQVDAGESGSPAAPVAAPAAPVAPAAPAHPPHQAEPHVAPGLPGGSPFVEG